MNEERRNLIKELVLHTLQYTQSNIIPIPIKKITRTYKNIRLIPYSLYMKLNNYNYEQMVYFAKTIDAFTDYNRKLKTYIICYNDINTEIINSNRYRWNIAHELGHVLLRHHTITNKARIFRNSLSDEEYNELEEEADYFASLLLVPYAALYEFVQTAYNIQQYCKISYTAANRRFYDFNKWTQHMKTNINDFYDVSIFNHYYNFIYRKKCNTCDAHLVQRHGKYCIICGKKTLKSGSGKMIYKKLEIHENGKLKICPVCKNEITNLEGTHCQICGCILKNECLNSLCKNFECNPLPSNARYCPICGEKSNFFQKKVLTSWEVEFEDINTTGFRNIPDGIDEEMPFN